MLFGLDGVEIGLLIVGLCLFGAILSGFPVAFALGGAALVSFGIIAALDGAGLLVHQAVDTGSEGFRALLRDGAAPAEISIFRYPDLPRVGEALFPGGWEMALDRNLSFIVNRINERVLAGASIETLLAVLMFVMMGITLERSRIANDLLTTMARVFGPLPGGLAVSVVVVGAFLAASTGIVGATVVTMGLLSLPTMLRKGYSPELSTGVIAASGTLGQIIPPSIVIVLLGTLAGDLYATSQEARAQALGCPDALTYLGQAAVVSVGTLFQAALLPGIVLALLYGLYAFGYALLNPAKAPPVTSGGGSGEYVTRGEATTWFLGVPAALVLALALAGTAGLVGGPGGGGGDLAGAPLRTSVSDQCQAAMIDLHGQGAWDRAVAAREAGGAADGSAAAPRAPSGPPPARPGIAAFALLAALTLSAARGITPSADARPLAAGALGVVLVLLADILLVAPATSPGATTLILALPGLLVLWSLREAARRLGSNDLVRVVFPPLLLIVAVLGSILGGITNPTPAAALGAGGAIMLAAYRRRVEEGRSPRIVVGAALAVAAMLLIGLNFDLRVGRGDTGIAEWIAYVAAQFCYLYAIFGLIHSCAVLWRGGVLAPVVRETAKVTSMVFTILIGSQLLNLVVISFGGEDYVQSFLQILRRRDQGLPDRDAGPVRAGLRARLPRDHLHRDPDRRAGDLRRRHGPEMGDDHDRGEPPDLVPDAALRLRAVLPARRGAGGGDDRADLSRRSPLRGDPGRRPGAALGLSGDRHPGARPVPELRCGLSPGGTWDRADRGGRPARRSGRWRGDGSRSRVRSSCPAAAIGRT